MIGKLIKNAELFMLDIFFPNRCPFCGDFIMWNESCCEDCIDDLTPANDVICHLCGQKKCRCYMEDYAFDRIYAAFFFDEIKDAVYSFKQDGNPNLAELAAQDCVSRMTEDKIFKADMVVPVPMGINKKRKRGHNQAEILGKSIGEILDIPVKRDILFKYDTKDEQHHHTEAERKDRVEKIFYKGSADLSGKKIIICDDVMTTGSTLSMCAAMLKDMGAEYVAAVVCAVTRLKQEKGA